MPSDKKVIALRLDDATRLQVEKLAAMELRSVANMVEILIRSGLRDVEARKARAETVARISTRQRA